MKKNANDTSLGIVSGSEDYSLQIENKFAELVGKFRSIVQQKAKDKQVINTGAMLSDDNIRTDIKEYEDKTVIDYFMSYYAKFVNSGVKGKDDDTNAPNSPYQFKNYGMSEEGRKSILNSVVSGKMKVSDESKTKYGRIKLETKAKETPNQEEINQREANQIIYLIKKFGIKTTGFIDEAAEQYKKELVKSIAEIAGKKIVFNLIETLQK